MLIHLDLSIKFINDVNSDMLNIAELNFSKEKSVIFFVSK